MIPKASGPSLSICHFLTLFSFKGLDFSRLWSPAWSCSCTWDCQGTHLIWGQLYPRVFQGWGEGSRGEVDEQLKKTLISFIWRRMKWFSIHPIPFLQGWSTSPNLPLLFLVLKGELPDQVNTSFLVKLGWLVTLQFPEFWISVTGRTTIYSIYKINKITLLSIAMLPYWIWRLHLRESVQNRDVGVVCKIPFGALGQEDSKMSQNLDKPHDHWLGKQCHRYSLMNKSNKQWFQKSSRLMLWIEDLICNQTVSYLGNFSG